MAVLGHTGEGASILWEHLLDDQRGLVTVVVVDLEVLAWLDDGRLPEPGDLWPGIALDLADEFHGGAVGSGLGLDLVNDLGWEGLLSTLGLCK